MGATNMIGVFSEGRAFYLPKIVNKRGGHAHKGGHLKMRGGKTKKGRLIPAERLGRMGTWLAMDSGCSDSIEDQQNLNSSMSCRNNTSSNDEYIAGKCFVT